MKSKEIFSQEMLDNRSKLTPEAKQEISPSRILILKEIIKRLQNINSEKPLTIDEIRQEIISYFKERYNRSDVWKTNLAIREEGIKDFLNLLYKFPTDNTEKLKDLQTKLDEIEQKLETYPPENLPDLIGVYQRMKK